MYVFSNCIVNYDFSLKENNIFLLSLLEDSLQKLLLFSYLRLISRLLCEETIK